MTLNKKFLFKLKFLSNKKYLLIFLVLLNFVNLDKINPKPLT